VSAEATVYPNVSYVIYLFELEIFIECLFLMFFCTLHCDTLLIII